MGFLELYFERDTDWYDWLLQNHNRHSAVYLIFYKLESGMPTMRWEEAVKVALCFGWIDSTVKSLGNGRRKQYFSPRNPKSSWSALNKKYILELEETGLIQEPGYNMINLAKKMGTWTAMDDVENGIIPPQLQKAFDANPRAYENYKNFSRGYQKSYLSWLNSAKREATKEKRIAEIIRLCDSNIKSRQ
ncbi:YdeI/OmpD-associated family protein [Winogradskyella alexanderae]|uniref:YdeI/OmpD-associated family protein n=1 Tax=Winogradskyella alexanderae TaxID=2877123 RepID=A0ABS7XRX0_9FLAO|nr:YdeI/OmpD-associated family protein [Winogradskyella alexanderae]MCA0132173.1 YdeI/OmpD-associated family protein [Winogradskyella alexanderae]